ncbi:LPXTG cell wall anchor domain-containing protein [Salinisphaera sp. SPP-AMP-43]|uniref:LPXTG cell wall anchor domain-containing protein n=1 Tax=Salinisphaera sp. SPP-AMP-43 TaxID=3121288 RepID=UPI003C6E2024
MYTLIFTIVGLALVAGGTAVYIRSRKNENGEDGGSTEGGAPSRGARKHRLK